MCCRGSRMKQVAAFRILFTVPRRICRRPHGPRDSEKGFGADNDGALQAAPHLLSGKRTGKIYYIRVGAIPM